MKFYIASRTSEIERVKEMARVLVEKGYSWTHDWTAAEDADLPRPYEKHLEKVQKFAEDDIAGARDADVFVINQR